MTTRRKLLEGCWVVALVLATSLWGMTMSVVVEDGLVALAPRGRIVLAAATAMILVLVAMAIVHVRRIP